MENEVLKQVFINLHLRIIDTVNPDRAIDVLLSKNIISEADYCELRQVKESRNRCRDLLALLYRSSHPQTFIELHIALVNEYSWIVAEIDEQLTSLSALQSQPHQEQPTDGQFLLN